uniref:Uncharacterized protein n=1 Tax=Sphaerodactylus townsendi TaxID=933632 RepID=A0ACB8FFQ5_9SAUR
MKEQRKTRRSSSSYRDAPSRLSGATQTGSPCGPSVIYFKVAVMTAYSNVENLSTYSVLDRQRSLEEDNIKRGWTRQPIFVRVKDFSFNWLLPAWFSFTRRMIKI